MDQLITSPTPEQLAQRAHLLGKMQTSLMRDGWGVTAVDAPAGTLDVLDAASYGMTKVVVSLSLPEDEDEPKPAISVHRPAKATAGKRKR